MTSGLGGPAEPLAQGSTVLWRNVTLLLAMPAACSMTLSITFPLWAPVSKDLRNPKVPSNGSDCLGVRGCDPSSTTPEECTGLVAREPPANSELSF